MAKKAELRGVLRLNNAPFVRAIKQSVAVAKGMARDFARNPLSATFVAGALVAQKSLGVARTAVTRFASGINTSMKVAGVGIAAAAATLLLFSKNSVTAAADLQTFRVGFEVLLGSMDKAEERMRMLVRFADYTPFELPEVVAASRALEVMTKGALSTEKGLTLVGDVASGTNTRFEETAVTIGRLFDAMRSGRSAGESLMRLQEIGALSGEARNRIEGLMTVNRGAEAWKVAQAEMMRFSGMMGRQSQTWHGLMSTLKDAIGEVMRSFGGPLIDRMTPALREMIVVVSDLAPRAKAAGEALGSSLKDGLDILKVAFTNPGDMVAPLIHTLKAGMLEAGNIFMASIRAAIGVIAGEGFFSALASGFWGLSQVISGYLAKAFQGPLTKFMAGIEWAMQKMNPANKGSIFDDAKMKHADSQIAGAEERVKKYAPGAEAPMFGMMGGPMRSTANPGLHAQALKDLVTAQTRKKILEEQSKSKPRVESMREIEDRLNRDGTAGALADDNIQEGTERIRKATTTLFGNIADALKDFRVDDVFGASGEMDKAKTAMAAAARRAADQAQANEEAKAVAKESAAKDAWRAKFQPVGLANLGTGGSLTTGGLSTGNLKDHNYSLDAPAERTTSLLPIAELRAFEDQKVAALTAAGVKGARKGSTPGAYGAVKRGDRERALEVEREKLREKMGIDKTNEILTAIRTRFDELTK